MVMISKMYEEGANGPPGVKSGVTFMLEQKGV